MSIQRAARREGPLDQMLLIGILVVLGATVMLWLTGEVASFVHARAWPRVTLSDMGTVLARIVRHPADPAAAWPPLARRTMPGPVLFWVTFVTLVVIAVALWMWLQALMRTVRKRIGRTTVVERPAQAPAQVEPSGWGRPQLFRELFIRDHVPWRVTLGRVNGRLVAAEALQPVIAIGPAQSLKTSGLTVPAVLEWDGPVLAASIRPDLVQHTITRRWGKGEVFLFDPAGITDMEASAWSPLTRCETWEGAYRMALALLGAGRGQGDEAGGPAPSLLASLLLAAAISSRTMPDVLRWAQRQETGEVTAALSVAGEPAAVDAFQSVSSLDRQAKGQAYASVLDVLGFYADPSLRESGVATHFSAERLLDAPANTAYVVLPAHEQRRLGPLVAALVQDVIDVASQRSRDRGAPLDPALLVVLDDAANSAPLAQLDVLAAGAAGHGVQLVTCFRHLGQMQARYAERADAVFAAHRAKVVLSGITDPPTLAHLSHLLGDETIRHLATPAALAKAGADGGSQAARARQASPAEALRWIAPGQGVLLYGHLPPTYLTLRPWFRDRRLSAQVAAADAGVEPR